MNPLVRAGLLFVILIAFGAGLAGCAGVESTASSVGASIGRIFHPAAPPPSSPQPAPGAPAPAGLDDYKAQVAHHVIEHNPGRSYDGILPPLLPAIVVLRITVDRDGELADVQVQRSRDPEASAVALASMRRSTPLPRPQQLAQADGRLTFSETFLFADHERYQLRSLAPRQASE